MHRHDCKTLLTDPNGWSQERVIDVTWDVDERGNHLPGTGGRRSRRQDRVNLLADISRAIGEFDCNIQSGTFDGAHEYARCAFIVEVRNLHHLDLIIGAIRRLPGVSKVQRSDHQFEGEEIDPEGGA